MHDRSARLASARLYLCTDARRERGDLAEFADAALTGGVDIIQLRDKGSPGEQQFGPLEGLDELAALAVLADAARRHGALFAVNDRADIARAAGADVLHLGQRDLPLAVAREIVGPGVLIGRSTHNPEMVLAAAAEDVDYFCVGPCWTTPTKPGRAAAGLQLLGTAVDAARTGGAGSMARAGGARGAGGAGGAKPWFGIGGISEERLPEVIAAGATRVVVVRAITAAADPRAAAQRMAAALAAAS